MVSPFTEDDIREFHEEQLAETGQGDLEVLGAQLTLEIAIGLRPSFGRPGGTDRDRVAASDGGGVPNNGASNVNNGIRLNHQLAAEEIAGGHGFQKHVLEQGEFAGLGIRTRQQYQNHIENVLNNPSSIRYTSDGRSFHLQESTGTVVVRNSSASDGGTAFQPQNWNDYVSGLPTRTEPY